MHIIIIPNLNRGPSHGRKLPSKLYNIVPIDVSAMSNGDFMGKTWRREENRKS